MLRDSLLYQLSGNNIRLNKFSIGVGKLTRAAREEAGLTQAEFANKTNRRTATISDIENGKSEIGVLTLSLFAITLNKPISFFFPASLLRDFVLDVRTPFQQDMLEIAKNIENFGDQALTLNVFKVLRDHFEDEYEALINGYPPVDE